MLLSLVPFVSNLKREQATAGGIGKNVLNCVGFAETVVCPYNYTGCFNAGRTFPSVASLLVIVSHRIKLTIGL